MPRRISLFILAFVILFSGLLSGCSDAMEVDDNVYALVIGVDKGVTNKVRVTIQYPTYKTAGGAGGGQKESDGKGGGAEQNKGEGAITHTVEASSILEGIKLYNLSISRAISLTHAKMLVISEDFAREGIENYLAPIARFREVRRTMSVVVVRGRAQDYIKENVSNIGESYSKTIELMLSLSKSTGYFPTVSFNEFYINILSPYNEAVAIYGGLNQFDVLPDKGPEGKSPLNVHPELYPGEAPRSGVAKREFVGTAVFSGAKMVGSLSSHETALFLMVTGEFNRGIMTIEDKRKTGTVIPFDISLGRKPIIRSRFENGKLVIDVKLFIEADVEAIQSRISYEDISMIGELDKMLDEHIQKAVEKTIKKTQTEYKSDIFGFGIEVAKHFNTIPEFVEYNWATHYPEAKINVVVDAKVRRTGTMIKSVPIRDPQESTGN